MHAAAAAVVAQRGRRVDRDGAGLLRRHARVAKGDVALRVGGEVGEVGGDTEAGGERHHLGGEQRVRVSLLDVREQPPHLAQRPDARNVAGVERVVGQRHVERGGPGLARAHAGERNHRLSGRAVAAEQGHGPPREEVGHRVGEQIGGGERAEIDGGVGQDRIRELLPERLHRHGDRLVRADIDDVAGGIAREPIEQHGVDVVTDAEAEQPRADLGVVGLHHRGDGVEPVVPIVGTSVGQEHDVAGVAGPPGSVPSAVLSAS